MKNLVDMLVKLFLLAIIAPLAVFAADNNVLRIGYQKSDPAFVLLKDKGYLEKRLAPLNVKVTWTEFPAGPQMLEGLNVGSIDLGTVGETPPIFAQAANAKIRYVGYKPASPKNEAIIVQKDSKIKTVVDLKGKKIALNKGSNVHYLLVKALEQAGLKYSDITPIFLPPADARAAFENGSVDAWVIWDPFYAAAEINLGAKLIKDGTGIVNSYQFYIAEENYASKRPDVISILFDELRKIDVSITKDPKAAALTLSSVNGLDPKVLELALSRTNFHTDYLNDSVIKYQQNIADTFYELKLIPKKLDVKSVVWIPEQKTK